MSKLLSNTIFQHPEKIDECHCIDWNEPLRRICTECSKEFMGIQGQLSMKDCNIHRVQMYIMYDSNTICPKCEEKL